MLTSLFSSRSRLIAAALFTAIPGIAHAHHPMGGMMPQTFGQGLLSGLGHPVIGIDHLAFIAAVGIAAAFIARGLLLPVLFVAVSILGVVVHLGAVNLPLVEPVIAASVLIAGILLARGREIPLGAWAGLFAVAGIFHGYAYGEAIVGAEAAPLSAYLAGLAIVQTAIALAFTWLTRRVAAGEIWRAAEARIMGGVVAGVGAVFVAEAVLPF